MSSQQKWLCILLDDDEEEAIYEFTETLFTLCTFNTHDLMDNKSVLQSPPSGVASLSADSFLFFDHVTFVTGSAMHSSIAMSTYGQYMSKYTFASYVDMK